MKTAITIYHFVLIWMAKCTSSKRFYDDIYYFAALKYCMWLWPKNTTHRMMMYIPHALNMINWKKKCCLLLFSHCGRYKYFREGVKIVSKGSEVKEREREKNDWCLRRCTIQKKKKKKRGSNTFRWSYDLNPSPRIDCRSSQIWLHSGLNAMHLAYYICSHLISNTSVCIVSEI